MTLLSQLAYPGPKILQPAAALRVWAALNRTTNPIGVHQILGMVLVVAPTFGKTVSGFFQDQFGNPITRPGYAIDRSSGGFITSFISDPVTGAFSFSAPNANAVIVILVPALGDARNAIILDDIIPI